MVRQKPRSSTKGEDLHQQISGKRVFSAHITNATKKVLEVQGKPMVSYGRCSHFSKLPPGEAGTIKFEHDGEHGGAFEFTLGRDRFFLGQYMRASYSSLFGQDQFVLEFSDKTLKQFYLGMPQHFMGLPNRGVSRTEGLENTAIVRKATCSTNSQVEVLLAPALSLHIFEDKEICLAQLAVAETCEFAKPELLSGALFIEEFHCLRDGLAHSSLHEQALALDLLIGAMIANGFVADRSVVGEGEVHGRIVWLLKPEGLASLARKPIPISSAKRQDVTLSWPLQGDGHGTVATSAQASHAKIGFDTNDAILCNHLQSTADTKLRGSVCSGQTSESADKFLQELVRSCVDASCRASMTRSRLFGRLLETCSPEAAGPLREYLGAHPLSRRCCSLKQSGKSEATHFEVFCAELFDNLDLHTRAQTVVASLGSSSGDYRSLSTNSKSGEFFFLSQDKKYLVKTISEDEGLLLFRMLPGYQNHIHSTPTSLIVRFAGLYSVTVAGGGLRYFIIMKSVFDPAVEIHSHYDLKGSLHHRKKKKDESTGKDEDWIQDKMQLSPSERKRQEMLEAHEADVQFLQEHGVMDYSVLVGIHNVAQGQAGPLASSTSAGTPSLCGTKIYFLGLIDFLINFGLRKQAEHLLRAAQGHGQSTSCVHPSDYAARQARFLRSSVFSKPDVDKGTAGCLRVLVVSARKLRNADLMSKSDPYVSVHLGLQKAATPTIQDDLNPTWNCSLTLPVNTSHLSDEILFKVWDEDHIRAAQGSDDSLGLLRCPFHRLLREGGEVDIKQKLEDSTLVLNVSSWYRYTSLLANCPAQGDYNWRAARADPL
ncbi:putative phosphatidylinositol 4-phosphate 5-kinase MSS4 [Symbiodinium microadriaticum]|uniref:Putative phosphatidylinositol 4-phosphate 5-kinase MSS4 n=1 Tax=Symbiodinium microadriaticum TaxID=2951 RepID=A0A1Q9CC98_SYMMI|nr:putative phosphatidylinositol 4-phosphate 5-kinase MSS4 [Symbiodinium microadriaticum]